MKQFAILLVVFIARAIHCQDDCSPDDVDVGELAERNIFMTSILQSRGITEEVVKKQLESTRDGTIDVIAKTEEDYKDAVEAGEESIEYEAPVSVGDDVASAAIAQELTWYKHVCPYRYYWLYKYRWAFYSNGKFCWAYYPIYVTSCSTRYCNWWYKPYSWYHYYRCFPRYVYIWIYARCVTFQNGQLTWSTEYVRRTVPRGCNCRRYFNPVLVANQCPATPTLSG